MKINIGIDEKSRVAVVGILTEVLADEYVLLTKTRNYHWNVVGPDFSELHKFFEGQYNEINDSIDEVAERSRQVGGNAIATLTEFLKQTKLGEQPGVYPSSQKMISNLLADHESLIRSLREGQESCMEEYDDAGTADFLTGLMEQHEKMAWMLRAFLETRGARKETAPARHPAHNGHKSN